MNVHTIHYITGGEYKITFICPVCGFVDNRDFHLSTEEFELYKNEQRWKNFPCINECKINDSSSSTNNRYKMFRNFLFNEMKLEKEDIKLWVQEAIAEEVTKLISKRDFGSLLEKSINSKVWELTNSTWSTKNMITDAINDVLRLKYTVDIVKREEK